MFRAVRAEELIPSQYLRSLFWHCQRGALTFDWRADTTVGVLEQAASEFGVRAKQIGKPLLARAYSSDVFRSR